MSLARLGRNDIMGLFAEEGFLFPQVSFTTRTLAHAPPTHPPPIHTTHAHGERRIPNVSGSKWSRSDPGPP